MRKRWVILILLAVVFLLIIFFGFIRFNNNVSSHMKKNLELRLQDIVEPNVVSFNIQMNEQIEKVKTFAGFLGSSDKLNSSSTINLLQAAVENNHLLRCSVVFPDGSFISHDTVNVENTGIEGHKNVSQDEFFIANMNGQFFITDPQQSIVEPSKKVMLFTSPIYKDNEIIGSLVYSYLCDDLDKIFNLTFMDSKSEMLIVKKEGELLLGNTQIAINKENVVESIITQCTHTSHDKTEFLSLDQKYGTTTINLSSANNQTTSYFLSYTKLDYKDWFLLAIIPSNQASPPITSITTAQQNFWILVGACISVYAIILFFLLALQNKNVDKMTGSLTLEAFKRKAKKLLIRSSNKSFVLVQIDIKNFKLINRIYSFEVGDRVVKSVATALSIVLIPHNAVFAHIGIDKFILLLPFEDAPKLQALRQLFIDTFYELMGSDFHTKINFPTGQYLITSRDFPKPDISEMLEKVNFAHKLSRQNYDTIIDYEYDIEKEALLEKMIEDRMATALTDEEFAVYLQPKFKSKEEKICGAEALVRWNLGDKCFIYPTDFIPVLERNGFIIQLDKYMFKHAAQKIRNLIDNGITPIPISVNFSRHHVSNENFVDELCEIADEYDVPRKYLEVELTESSIYGHVEQIAKLLEKLHNAGFLLSMDDFGSGYSCLAQLKDLPVDVLKLDKGFFNDNSDENRSKIVVSSILEMAKRLDITVVAEGVETREQLDMLKELNCDIIQGYYFSKPIPANEVDAMLPKSN